MADPRTSATPTTPLPGQRTLFQLNTAYDEEPPRPTRTKVRRCRHCGRRIHGPGTWPWCSQTCHDETRTTQQLADVQRRMTERAAAEQRRAK